MHGQPCRCGGKFISQGNTDFMVGKRAEWYQCSGCGRVTHYPEEYAPKPKTVRKKVKKKK